MMNKCIALLTAVLLAVCLFNTAAFAQPVSADDARLAAQNHVSRTIARLGSWGGAPQAQATDVQVFGRKNRDLGYIVTIQPSGYVILFGNRRLPPIKAYSMTGRLDITQDQGPADLIKGRMSKTFEKVEEKLGKDLNTAQKAAAVAATGANYTDAWDALLAPAFEAPASPPTPTYEGMDYRPGQTLLVTNWDQYPPYNNQCPYQGCTSTTNGRAFVGCVATAGVQILRYWCWPPCDSTGAYVDAYNWTNMPWSITDTSPPDQIDCVAAASRSVGNSASMVYGCDGSSASHEDMETVYENRRYPSAGQAWRSDFTDSEWWDRITSQIDQNQPIQYGVDDHSIVCDGWYTDLVAGVTEWWYHWDYGWTGTGSDVWYLFDTIPLHFSNEDMLRRICPDVALGTDLAGMYSTQWISINHFDKPTRYFNRDCTGVNAEFSAGQALQYVRPGLWIRNVGTLSTDTIKFQGASGWETEFYHQAPYGDKRIRVLDGVIKIYGGGEMRLR